MKRITSVVATAVAAAALAAGCATQSPPTEQLAFSEAAFRDALRAGAADAAPAELALARRKLELTRRWMEVGDYKPARWLAEQAQVDAELASMKAMARGRP